MASGWQGGIADHLKGISRARPDQAHSPHPASIKLYICQCTVSNSCVQGPSRYITVWLTPVGVLGLLADNAYHDCIALQIVNACRCAQIA